MADLFLLSLPERSAVERVKNNYCYSAGLGSVQKAAHHLPLWAKCMFGSNKLKWAMAAEVFTPNSSHVSFFSPPSSSHLL